MEIECENETGRSIDLHDALLVRDLRVNLFNLHTMRQASIRLEYLEELGTIWMMNKSGAKMLRQGCSNTRGVRPTHSDQSKFKH